MELRREEEKDYREVENLTREAFWDVYKPGCDEHLVIHKLRKTSAYIPELDFVVMEKDRIIGNIIYSRAVVENEAQNKHEVLSFGPISVLPEYQGKGIGSLMINHTKNLAAEMGYKAILIFGNPAYYHRFGFCNAQKYHITTSEGKNFDAFMALELQEGSLSGITGRFYEDSAFSVSLKELEEFEKGFPFKEKHVTDTQLM